MNKLTVTVAAVALLSGCGAMPTHTTRDRSTGEETALIEGLNEFWTDCSIHGPLPIDLSDHMPPTLPSVSSVLLGVRADSPYDGAGSPVVDAGPFTVDVTCRAYTLGQRKLSFSFVAETGHIYTFTDSDMKCIRLLDITFEETVITCEPYKKTE